MEEEYTIKEYNTCTCKDEILYKVFDFLDIIFREFEKDDPLPTEEYRMKGFRTKSPSNDDYNWLVWKGDKVIGLAYLVVKNKNNASFEENKHVGFFDIRVLKDHRRKGIGTELFSTILQKAKEIGFVETLQNGTTRESGFKFNEHYNGILAMESVENRCYISEVNWDLMNDWVKQGRDKGKQEGRTLQWFEACPEDIVEDFCEVYTETMNQQPLGELETRPLITPESRRETEKLQEERGFNWHTIITREKNGKISGVTDVTYIPGMSHKIYQELTGVLKQYRGNGLGKWLKAEMLNFIQKQYPDVKYIQTGNADANAPMLSINTRMGFKAHKHNKAYKFKIKELEKELQK